jgi:hypothetical protein
MDGTQFHIGVLSAEDAFRHTTEGERSTREHDEGRKEETSFFGGSPNALIETNPTKEKKENESIHTVQ